MTRVIKEVKEVEEEREDEIATGSREWRKVKSEVVCFLGGGFSWWAGFPVGDVRRWRRRRAWCGSGASEPESVRSFVHGRQRRQKRDRATGGEGSSW